MTQSVYDIYGWGSIEARKHEARAWAWCIKHREQYSMALTTVGPFWRCDSCDQEWLEKISLDKTP